MSKGVSLDNTFNDQKKETRENVLILETKYEN